MNNAFSVIHLSDLHFGRIHPQILRDLETFLSQRKREIKLAILTGDLTQRAREHEFIAAKEFASALPCPFFVVPGNHDVPLYNLFLRFFSPYKKFLSHLGPFAQNFYEDDYLAVYGLWTVNNFAVSSGKLLKSDLQQMEEKFRDVPAHKIKIVAGHHPLTDLRYPGIEKDLQKLLDIRPHFLMWGHEHRSGVKPFVPNESFPLALAAGTSTSTRLRAEANSFNYLTFDNGKAVIEVFSHSKLLKNFEVTDRKEFSLFKNFSI